MYYDGIINYMGDNLPEIYTGKNYYISDDVTIDSYISFKGKSGYGIYIDDESNKIYNKFNTNL